MAKETEAISTEVGTTLLFENERLRVWEMSLEPGESIPVHRHLYDHVLVYVDDSKILGRLGESESEAIQEVESGWVAYREVGKDGSEAHSVENIGSERSRHFIVELVGPSASEELKPAVGNGRGGITYGEQD